MSSERNVRLAIFGCWNNYTKGPPPISGFDYVSTYLTNHQAEYNELVILGDNYYPDKEPALDSAGREITIDGKKIKTAIYDRTELSLGFKALEKIRTPIKYLIMGNHDLEDTLLNKVEPCIGLKDELSLSAGKRIKKISSDKLTEHHNDTESHKTYADTSRLGLKKEFIIPFPYGSKDKQLGSIKYKYIFVDTNAYSLQGSDNTCFKIIGKTALEVKNEQNSFITECVNDSTTNIFLVFGHNPLVSAKTTDKKTIKSSAETELAKILLESHKTIYYICADVHMFQHGTITGYGHSLTQIVCGTGGADKDKFDSHIQVIEENGINYDLQRVAPSYGFVDMVLSDTGISWEYYKIKEDATKMYEMKYLIKYS